MPFANLPPHEKDAFFSLLDERVALLTTFPMTTFPIHTLLPMGRTADPRLLFLAGTLPPGQTFSRASAAQGCPSVA